LTSVPPTTKTLPLGSSVAAWTPRRWLKLAAGAHVFVVTAMPAFTTIGPDVAEIVTLLTATPVTIPPVTIATEGSEVDQVAVPEMFCALPSE